MEIVVAGSGLLWLVVLLGPALAGGPAEGACLGLVLWRSLSQASSIAIFNVFIIPIVVSYISLNKKMYFLFQIQSTLKNVCVLFLL